MNSVGQVLKQIGSLWWTNVLLLLLALAMGVATAVESTTSSELAQIQYYHTDWFQGLLALLAVNATASLLVHWPWTTRNFGFVLTHGSLVIILLGAAVTRFFAFDGSIGIAEGESKNTVYDRHVAELALTDLSTGGSERQTVSGNLLNTLKPLKLQHGARITLGNVTLEATEYSPDAVLQQIFVASNHPMAPAAAEITLSHADHDDTAWISEGQLMPLHGATLLLRHENDAAAFADLLAGKTNESDDPGMLTFELEGQTQTLPLPEVNAEPVPIGETGITVQVTASFAQAIVGEGGVMTEGPGTKPNPAVQLVLRRGDDEAKRMVFANFPDFTHQPDALGDIQIRYQAGSQPLPKADLTLIAGPEGQLAVQPAGAAAQTISVDQPITLPGGGQLRVNTWLAHAQASRGVRTRDPLGKNRVPALALKLSAGDSETTTWLRRNDLTTLQFAGKPYRIEFGFRTMPLPFDIQLDKFVMGLYPGGRAPRSYSSQVTLTEHSNQMQQPALISMNAPLTHHGYTFFQSSYDIDGGQRVSYLSVSRDPGRPIVYTGYVGLVLGMFWVLSTRMRGVKPAGGAT